MQIMDSYIEAGQELGEEARKDYYTAVIEFLYCGKEPELEGSAKAVFTAIKPVLENTRARSLAGKKKANAKQEDEQNESKTESNDESNADQNADQNGSKTAIKTEANDESNGVTKSKSKSKSKSNYKETPSSEGVKKRARFKPPTVEEVRSYAESQGHPEFNAPRFVDYYEANGWKAGRNPMKSWPAAVRNWISRDEEHREVSHASDFSAYASVYDS